MKKILLISSLLIFACSSDDDNSNDSNSIEGRWNFISSTDCGELDQDNDSCDFESYMTLNNGAGEATIYDNEDQSGNIIPCQVAGSFDVSYMIESNSSNSYVFDLGDGPLSATLSGNTLTLFQEVQASDTGCTQQEGTFIEEVIFMRD